MWRRCSSQRAMDRSIFPSLQRLGERREVASQNLQFTVIHPVPILVQTAGRRTRGVRAIFIKGAPMTRTHEQPRFLEPANRATQMGAVDGEDLNGIRVDPADPARYLRRVTVPWLTHGVAVNGKPCLAGRELVEIAE